MDFKTTIGLEIHVELNTKRKMFCDCQNPASLSSNISDREPNSFCCPTCMGLPGTLPRVNKKAIKFARIVGLALNCEIQKESKFDRKHYFYPDLPKGYQISQYDMPFCRNGKMKIQDTRDKTQKTIRINRVHLEEDAGKLIHPSRERAETSPSDQEYSLVDLNRAGTPLLEIVTEPDIESPEEARKFVKILSNILIGYRVSDVNMEKGHLRCDANIDIKIKSKIIDNKSKLRKSIVSNSEEFSTSSNNKCLSRVKVEGSPIVEIKNLNSFRFIEKALEYEIERLVSDQNNWPKEKTKQTRGFNSKTGETYAQRAKEESADYRYFPEPDLPLYVLSDQEKKEIEEIKKEYEGNITNYQDLGLSEKQSEMLKNNHKLNSYFDKAYDKIRDPKLVYSWVCVELLSIAKKQKKDIAEILDFNEFINLLLLIKTGKISNHLAKIIFAKMIESKKSAQTIIKEQGIGLTEYDFDDIIKNVLENNFKAVEDYKNGQQNAVGFLVGQVMKETKGQANPQEIREKIKKIIG